MSWKYAKYEYKVFKEMINKYKFVLCMVLFRYDVPVYPWQMGSGNTQRSKFLLETDRQCVDIP